MENKAPGFSALTPKAKGCLCRCSPCHSPLQQLDSEKPLGEVIGPVRLCGFHVQKRSQETIPVCLLCGCLLFLSLSVGADGTRLIKSASTEQMLTSAAVTRGSQTEMEPRHRRSPGHDSSLLPLDVSNRSGELSSKSADFCLLAVKGADGDYLVRPWTSLLWVSGLGWTDPPPGCWLHLCTELSTGGTHPQSL